MCVNVAMRAATPFMTVLVIVALQWAGSALACDAPAKAIGLERTVVVDTTGGPKFGSHQYDKTIDLKDGEVILTFDDGPHPTHTISILKTLKRHCTKATFFAVGQMVSLYPKVLKLTADQGHTIGTHTWSHANIAGTRAPKNIRQIERGFQATALAAGGKIAPFFRYPYLSHSKRTEDYLIKNNIGVFSVDVISPDTKTSNPSTIVRSTLARLKNKKKGMILFHDIKKGTARALPTLLAELKKRKYKIVHMVPTAKRAFPIPVAKNKSAPDNETGDTVKVAAQSPNWTDFFLLSGTKYQKHKIKRVRKQKKKREKIFKLWWED